MTDKNKQCGTEADWLDGSWPDCMSDIEVAPGEELTIGLHSNVPCIPSVSMDGKTMQLGLVIPSAAAAGSVVFAYDLAVSMIDRDCGYDPYNHVGDNIILDVIGIEAGA